MVLLPSMERITKLININFEERFLNLFSFFIFKKFFYIIYIENKKGVFICTLEVQQFFDFLKNFYYNYIVKNKKDFYLQ